MNRTKAAILAAAKYVGRRGRPPKINESAHARNVRIPDRVWDAIPHPKSDSVRKALEQVYAS